MLLLAATCVIAALGLIEWSLDPVAFQRALGLPPFEGVRGEVNVVKSIFLHPAQFGWLTTFGALILYANSWLVALGGPSRWQLRSTSAPSSLAGARQSSAHSSAWWSGSPHSSAAGLRAASARPAGSCGRGGLWPGDRPPRRSDATGPRRLLSNHRRQLYPPARPVLSILSEHPDPQLISTIQSADGAVRGGRCGRSRSRAAQRRRRPFGSR